MSKYGSFKSHMPWEVTLKEDHPRSKYKRGTTWTTKEWGDITIVGQCDIPYVSPVDGRVRYMWFLVEFSDGTQVVAERPHIASGKIKNPFHPSIYKRGFLGQGEFNSKEHIQEYETWHNMMERCYTEERNISNVSYEDCEVDERWWNFQNFCKDLKLLKNYSLWKKYGGKQYHLDKDIKITGNRLYSKDTCLLVNAHDNMSLSGQTGLTYIGTRLADGHRVEFTNQTTFCLEYGIKSSSGICKVLSGERTHYCGWFFEIKEKQGE